MFNLGLPEMILLSMVALLVFGPKRLPELAKGLGQGIRDFKKALSEDDNKTSTSKIDKREEQNAAVTKA